MTVQDSINTDDKIVRVFIVRHGQTEHNKNKIMQGHLNVPLNGTGVAQAERVGERFSSFPMDSFVTSDLTRCVETISKITTHHDIGDLEGRDNDDKFRRTSNLRERFMGPVEGMPLKDVLEKYGKNFRDLGENKEQLLKRLDHEWDQIIQDSNEKGHKNVLVCTHGGAINAFIQHLINDLHYVVNPNTAESPRKVPFNTSVTVVDVNKEDQSKSIIQLYGDTSHLGDQLEVTDQLLR